MELDPTHTSTEHPWFKRSVEKEDPFTSYYVWADGKTASDGRRNPPNNWVSHNLLQVIILLYHIIIKHIFSFS